ncbi:MAG: bifunctional oligoribonuclease/PAP phosphatase NrnA [Oscillospiraceae bacterium]|nr:bifunctional oligoribonuclease/PAP phosphatase NrnA [Oscillospiraceae bacterium]
MLICCENKEGVAGQISLIAEALKTKGRIAVLSHNNADGDTLGSCIAACIALQKLGKDVSMIYEEDFPENMSDIRTGHDFYMLLPPGDDSALERKWDAIAVFDAADPKLLGRRAKLLEKAEFVVNIDHHISNYCFGDLNIVDADASSTAEIVYQLIEELGVPLDHDMALAIYAGICTDTGGFSYSNTTAVCHEIAARTLMFGIDVANLRFKFFDAISIGKLHCHGYVANTLKLHEGGKCAIVVVSAATLAELGATGEDCEGLVNIGRNIVGVKVSMFAREVRPGEFRINLRSRGDVDVSAIARLLDGGGHRSAAGCTIKAAPSEVEAILLGALREVCN